jgi:hypothetical protein
VFVAHDRVAGEGGAQKAGEPRAHRRKAAGDDAGFLQEPNPVLDGGRRGAGRRGSSSRAGGLRRWIW